MFHRKNKIIKELTDSFGKVKDAHFHFEGIERYFLERENKNCMIVVAGMSVCFFMLINPKMKLLHNKYRIHLK